MGNIFKKIRRKLLCVLLYTLHKKLIKDYLEHNSIRKLQIGCGRNILKCWLNTDLNPTKEIVALDATKRFPFSDNTFDYIFSEHCIEHLQYFEGQRLVRECYRILKPKGKLRISTPDLRFLINLYSRRKTKVQERYIVWATKSFLPHVRNYSDTFVINNFFHAWNHKFIYDFKTLQNLLELCGFGNIVLCSPGKSDDVHLQGIESHGCQITDEFNNLESIVVEATKPTSSHSSSKSEQNNKTLRINVPCESTQNSAYIHRLFIDALVRRYTDLFSTHSGNT